MPTELTPGALTAILTRIGADYTARTGAALSAVGDTIRTETERELRRHGAHPRGTKTPAAPGGPPAMITGTLAASMVATRPTFGADGWSSKVGLAPGRGDRTPSSLYGRFQEFGTSRMPARPFLGPVTMKWAKPEFIAPIFRQTFTR